MKNWLPLGMKAQPGVGGQLFQIGGPFGHSAEEVVHLAQGDDQGDAGGEAHDDRHGNEADELAQAQQAGGQQQRTGGKAGQEHALQAVAGHDAHQHGAHGPGGAGHLIGRAPQQGDDHARHDGGHKARGGRGPAGHAEGQRQRQRHGAHREPRHHVAAQAGGVVAREFRPQAGKKLFHCYPSLSNHTVLRRGKNRKRPARSPSSVPPRHGGYKRQFPQLQNKNASPAPGRRKFIVPKADAG